jgi:bacterioferritin
MYRKIIKAAAKMGDRETRRIFVKIYAEEEKHLFKFQEYSGMKDEAEGADAAVSPWRKIYTADYFALLNKAVAAEISAILQYTNQHEKASLLALRKKNTALEVVTEANKAKVVSDMLKSIFMQEMEHLEKIAERIYLLEGEAVTVPDPLPEVGKTTEDFVKLDQEAENIAIVLYRQIIAEALKRGDTTTKRMFEDIVMQEEEHYWSFDDFIK